MTRLDELLYEMTRYDDKDVKRIQHFLKVHEFARLALRRISIRTPRRFWRQRPSFMTSEFTKQKKSMEETLENIRRWRDRARRGPC